VTDDIERGNDDAAVRSDEALAIGRIGFRYDEPSRNAEILINAGPQQPAQPTGRVHLPAGDRCDQFVMKGRTT